MSDTVGDNDEALLSLLARAALDVTGRPLEGLTMNTRLADTGIDSVGVLEMVGFVEDELGLRFADDEIARLSMVRDVQLLIAKTRAAQAAP